MPRLESTAKGGYYPFPAGDLPALASLVAPAAKGGRILDPCAGCGTTLQHISSAWNLEPFANEIDGELAAQCVARFGPLNAIQGDLFQLRAPTGAFVAAWVNPPYTQDVVTKQRRELQMLKHAIRWVQTGGLLFWAVYAHHVTTQAALFLAQHSQQVDLWRSPRLHLEQYVHVVVAARIGPPPENHESFALRIYNEGQRLLKADIDTSMDCDLLPQAEPHYELPAPIAARRFYFTPKVLNPETILRLAQTDGAHRSAAFQRLLTPPPETTDTPPVVQPADAQLALILASGLFNGLVIDLGGRRAAVRSTITLVEELDQTTVEGNPDDEQSRIEKHLYRTKPKVTVTTLDAAGEITTIASDDGLVDFILKHKAPLKAYLDRRFHPLYTFDPPEHLVEALNQTRVEGRFPLWDTQKHAIAACYAMLRRRRGGYLVGEPGIGKTVLGSTLALLMQREAKPGQVAVITCPPHMVPKWKRELKDTAASNHTPLLLHAIDSRDRKLGPIVDQAEQFFRQAAKASPRTLKVILIPRELTKLGEGSDVAVQFKTLRQVRWAYGQPRPENVPEDRPRIGQERVAICPRCGEVVTRRVKDADVIVTEAFLRNKDARRSLKLKCRACGEALWQQVRTFSAPKEGEKYPSRSPRVPLAEHIARRHPGRVFLYLADEVHELKEATTGQGQALMSLANAADHTLGLTGTLYGGVASSLYMLEYLLNERVRRDYPWTFGGRTRWVKRMGVLERSIEYRPAFDESGRFTGVNKFESKPEEAPGCSPELLKEIVDHTVFVGLLDSGKAMPPYEEIAVPVPMGAVQASRYTDAREKLGTYLHQQRLEGDNTFRVAYLQGLLAWPNAPWRDEVFVHKKKLNPNDPSSVWPITVHTIEGLGEMPLFPKEQELLRIVDEELAQGRRVGVYCRQTGERDIQPRLAQIIEQHNPLARTWTLYADRIAPDKREERLAAEVERGVNVLLVNPRAVQTGLDLVAFPTLVWYEGEYSLPIVGQASRRAWRLIQDQPCRVYFLFYEDTMEERAVQLVGRKNTAAKLLYGQAVEGLSAFIDNGGSTDLLVELTSSFTGEQPAGDTTALFGRTDVTVDRSRSVWLSSIDAHPDAFCRKTPPAAEARDDLERFAVEVLGATITRVIPAPVEAPEPVFAAPPQQAVVADTREPGRREPAPLRREPVRKRRRVTLDMAPDDIALPSRPERRPLPAKPARKPAPAAASAVQLALFGD